MFTFLRKMSVGTAVGASYLDPTLNWVNAIFLQIDFPTIHNVVVRITVDTLHLSTIRTKRVLPVGF